MDRTHTPSHILQLADKNPFVVSRMRRRSHHISVHTGIKGDKKRMICQRNTTYARAACYAAGANLPWIWTTQYILRFPLHVRVRTLKYSALLYTYFVMLVSYNIRVYGIYVDIYYTSIIRINHLLFAKCPRGVHDAREFDKSIRCAHPPSYCLHPPKAMI